MAEEDELLETGATTDLEDADEVDETKEAPAGDEGADTKKVDEPQPQAGDEVKRWRDEATQTKGHLAVALKAVKTMKDEFGATDEEIAEKLGRTVADVKAILGQEPAADDPIAAAATTLIEQYGTPEKPGPMKAALDVAFDEDTSEAFKAYDWLLGADPTERQKLAEQNPSKLAAYAVKRGKEVMAEYEELKTHGSPLAAYRALKAKPKDDVKPIKETPSSQPSTPQPQPAAETGSFTKSVLG